MSGKKASKSKSPARKSKPEGSPSAVASESPIVANKSKPAPAARKGKAKKDSGSPAAVNLEAQSQGQGEVAQGVKTRKQKLKTAEAQEQGKDKKQKTGTKKIAKKPVARMHFDEDDGPHAYSMYTSAGGDAVDECLFRFYRETDLSELKSESELYGKVDAFLTKNMPKKHSEWSDTASREEILETVVARWKSASKKSSAKKQTATKPDPSDDEPDDDKPQEDADDDTPPEYDGERHPYSMFSEAGADAVGECLGKFQNSVNLASIKTEDELFDKMYEFFQKHMPKKYSEWSDTASRDQIFESLIGQWEDAKAEVNA